MKKFFKLQRDYIDNIKSNTEVIHDIIFNDIKSVLSENRKVNNQISILDKNLSNGQS